MPPRVVVLGAGVIGLSCARHLRRRGAHVQVLDGSTGARESSWAAGGILGAGSESVSDTPLFRLARDAWAAWPAVAADLERTTGIPLHLRRDGSLLVALEAADVPYLEARERFLAGAGFPARLLSATEARGREPALAPGALAALWIGEGRLDNRRLWDALAASCRASGVEIRPGVPAEAIEDRGGTVSGVRTPAGTQACDAVVLATGAWSADLARTAGVELPTVPVKGQMVRLEAPDGLLSHVVKREIAYAVPVAGQGVVVGTTAEVVGFDRSLHEEALEGLVTSAARIAPVLATLRRTEAWAGFRPRLADLLPAIGPVPRRPGLFVATGHFRNGILLCDVTGSLVAEAVLGRVDPRLSAFDPLRFEGPASPTAAASAPPPSAPRPPA